ncbi:purine-cytosine permease-like protein [Xylogone sp. PMI_703]|nr:purine-cytosine permease-like protein [Xylogone sp. PMI_703]
MGPFSKNETDVEVQGEKPISDDNSYIPDDGAVPAETFVIGDSWYAKVQRFAGQFGVEQRGIERVPSDERTDASMSQIGTMWLSANMVVSAFAIGALAYPVFFLGFIDTILVIFFINILGILPVCFFSTFGPRFGLRQMVLSRFWFGWYAVKIIAIFNVLACVGWSSVNVIVGAQLFNAVNHDMPGWAGIIVIAAATFFITLFGYKIVHTYERWSWIPCFIIFMIVLGEFAHSGNFNNIPMGKGKAEAGAVLSFAASVFGFATGWTSYAADYTVYQPVGRSRRSVFIWTFGGLIFPLLFCEMLGAAVATAMVNNQAYADGYSESGIGGLLAAVLFPPLGGFGKFCLVILALSIIANNCPNIYSVSLSLQLLARFTQHVPRFIWTFVGTLVYCAIAIPGYSHFESVLENFMLVIGYWLAIYEGISLSEHFIFKRGFGGYHPEHYLDKNKQPPGLAASLAFCFGVMGAVLGMAQVWFTGPIGKLCGTEFGGDVGFELAFSFAAISFIVLRSIEKSYFKR